MSQSHHGLGGGESKGSNTVIPPQATPKVWLIPVLKSIKSPKTPYWPLRNYDLGPSALFHLCFIKATSSQENKTSSPMTRKRGRGSEEGWRKEQDFEKVLQSEIHSPKLYRKLCCHACIGELISAAQNEDQEAPAKCTRGSDGCEEVMSAVAFSTREERRAEKRFFARQKALNHYSLSENHRHRPSNSRSLPRCSSELLQALGRRAATGHQDPHSPGTLTWKHHLAEDHFSRFSSQDIQHNYSRSSLNIVARFCDFNRKYI